MGNLAVNYRDAGHPAEALPLLEEAIRLGRAHAGTTTVPLFHITEVAAELHTALGQHAEAERCFRALIDLAREAEGEGGAVASWQARLGLNLIRQDRFKDAEPLIRAALAVRQREEPDDWRTFNTQALLGRALLGQGKATEAEAPLLTGCQGMLKRETQMAKDAKPRLHEALSSLVQLYEAAGNKEEAAKWKAESAKRATEAPKP
jgi:tetratricopeptide (TPR) repeat protein